MRYYTADNARVAKQTYAVFEENFRRLWVLRHQDQHFGYIRDEIRHALRLLRAFRGNNLSLLLMPDD